MERLGPEGRNSLELGLVLGGAEKEKEVGKELPSIEKKMHLLL